MTPLFRGAIALFMPSLIGCQEQTWESSMAGDNSCPARKLRRCGTIYLAAVKKAEAFGLEDRRVGDQPFAVGAGLCGTGQARRGGAGVSAGLEDLQAVHGEYHADVAATLNISGCSIACMVNIKNGAVAYASPHY